MTTVLLLALQLRVSDPWFGSDKLKHFFLTAFIQTVTYSTLRLTNADHRSSILGASAASAAAGVTKEMIDRRRYGLFSVKDLLWDAAGAGGASIMLTRTR
jgi:putative lipoprotein